MAKVDAARVWALNYKLLADVMAGVSDQVTALGLEMKELFVLNEIEECPYPAGLASRLSMPKATITLYLKNLEANGFIRREIDPQDLRRHRLTLTSHGKKVATQATAILSSAFGLRLAGITLKEQAEFQRTLEKLNEAGDR